MLQKERTTATTANLCSVMESGNHSKNGASLKSLMSKGNLLITMCVLVFLAIAGACKEGEEDDYIEPEPELKPLTAPTGLTATQITDGFKVSWNPVEGADGYKVNYYYKHFDRYDLWGNITYTTFEHTEDIQDCEFLYKPEYDAGLSLFSFSVCSYRAYERSNWSDTVTCNYIYPGGGAETGLYMGIIGFNEELNERKISLLTDYKNIYNTNNFTSFVNALNMKPATSLYYAVDNAIKRLEIAKLPEDLVNVSIVTFTDGLDNASIDLNTAYNSRDAYRDAVKKRIANTRIKDLPINAYSIGIRGSDVNDVEAFRAGLISMASRADNAKEVTNMEEVNEKFSEIAASLYNENASQVVKLKITGGYDDGTKIRFTLDDVEDAAESEFYIEGVYKRNGTERTLQNVVYHGVKSSSGSTISGDVSGVYVTFSFEGFEIIEPPVTMYLKDIRQWEYIASNAQWQKNSEFGQAGDIETIVDKKSAVIMLVLDCTTSLGDSDFGQMKDAATNFIRLLTGKD